MVESLRPDTPVRGSTPTPVQRLGMHGSSWADGMAVALRMMWKHKTPAIDRMAAYRAGHRQLRKDVWEQLRNSMLLLQVFVTRLALPFQPRQPLFEFGHAAFDAGGACGAAGAADDGFGHEIVEDEVFFKPGPQQGA